MNKNLKILINKLPKLKESFEELVKREVLVGVPSDKAARKEKDAPSNAMLAYIHDNGSPARNIPARPFMKPGIEKVKGDIEQVMKIGATSCLDGEKSGGDRALVRAGLIAQASIRSVINEGIDPALAASTLRGRIRARRGAKGAKAELANRAAGLGESATGSAKPLIVTGQLRNSINFVIREK
jgi:hypothetical protein